ncbi:MAG: choice-of-anchor K domain-containing protein [Burkholderiales bacterium]|nr:choice-of-anchor K domain-containing protein [Burkholderiales bacterium]
MKTIPIATAAALAALSFSAHATPVSVTASFDRFTMGGFYNADHTYAAGLSVNNVAIDVCGGDSTCAAAMANPASVTTALGGGASVAFGYNPALLPAARMNQFSFTGNTADVAGTGPGNQFVLGSFTYTNGSFYPLAFIDFTLTTHSTNASLDGQTFTGRIRLDTNSGDETNPEAEADYFIVLDTGGSTLTALGSVRVYDYSLCPQYFPGAPGCNSGSVDVLGHIASLHLDGFTNATGGAFTNSSTGPGLNPGTGVPEPGTLLLAALGLMGIGAARRR